MYHYFFENLNIFDYYYMKVISYTLFKTWVRNEKSFLKALGHNKK